MQEILINEKTYHLLMYLVEEFDFKDIDELIFKVMNYEMNDISTFSCV